MLYCLSASALAASHSLAVSEDNLSFLMCDIMESPRQISHSIRFFFFVAVVGVPLCRFWLVRFCAIATHKSTILAMWRFPVGNCKDRRTLLSQWAVNWRRWKSYNFGGWIYDVGLIYVCASAAVTSPCGSALSYRPSGLIKWCIHIYNISWNVMCLRVQASVAQR